MSAASDDDLAAHERSAGGHGYVVLLAFPARPAVEGDLLRDPVDALQDRQRVAGQCHAAHALADLALHDPEARLRDGLERPADRVFHPTDPLARQHAGLRFLHDLILLVAARAEVRVRHAHPDPAAEVLRPAVAGGAGLQHAGCLEAVQETAIAAPVDDRGLVGRRALRVEWDGAVGPGIGAVVVHRDQRRADLLAHLVREEGALLDDLVALRCVAHDFVCQQAGDAGIRHDRHEARRRLRRTEHLDGLLCEASAEGREVQRLDELPARGPIPQIERGLAAITLAGNRLDRVRRPAGGPRSVAPRSVDECADAPAPTMDLVDALDLFVRDAYDERRAILRADVAEARARFLEGPHRGGHELRHGRPRRRPAIKGFRAPGRGVTRRTSRRTASIRRYILLWGYYFISRDPSRGPRNAHAVAPAISRSAVLPDGHGELVEETVRAGAERARPPGHLARHDHRDLDQRPERTRVRALPHDLRRPHRRVRKHRGRARVEADVRHAEPRSARLGGAPALLHGDGPGVDRPVDGLI